MTSIKALLGARTCADLLARCYLLEWRLLQIAMVARAAHCGAKENSLRDLGRLRMAGVAIVHSI